MPSSEWQTLRDYYVRIARRYATVFGPPPDLSPEASQLRADVQMMVDALNNRVTPAPDQAGPAVKAGEQELHVQVTKQGVTGHVMLELVNAEGQTVSTRHELLQPLNLDVTVRTILESAETMALEREQQRTGGEA
jgi:hypothetical protein